MVPLTNVTIKIHLILLFTLHNNKNIACHITELLIFYAYKLMVIGNSKNSHVFNFAILLKSQKSRKFDARKIYMFYSMQLTKTHTHTSTQMNLCTVKHNPMQKTVRTAPLSVLMTVHSFSTQYNTEQF